MIIFVNTCSHLTPRCRRSISHLHFNWQRALTNNLDRYQRGKEVGRVLFLASITQSDWICVSHSLDNHKHYVGSTCFNRTSLKAADRWRRVLITLNNRKLIKYRWFRGGTSSPIYSLEIRSATIDDFRCPEYSERSFESWWAIRCFCPNQREQLATVPSTVSPLHLWHRFVQSDPIFLHQ